jgi:hypothetical protein
VLLQRIDSGLGAVGEVELGEIIGDMGFDGAFPDGQM